MGSWGGGAGHEGVLWSWVAMMSYDAMLGSIPQGMEVGCLDDHEGETNDAFVFWGVLLK